MSPLDFPLDLRNPLDYVHVGRIYRKDAPRQAHPFCNLKETALPYQGCKSVPVPGATGQGVLLSYTDI